MSDRLTSEAAVEYRAERIENLFRQYIEQLQLAQSTHDSDEWIKAGSVFQRFAKAAVTADMNPYSNPYGDAP